MFEACMTYESGLIENEEFPNTNEPVWILGKKFSVRTDLEELQADVRSKLWFTYRKNFNQIDGNGPDSDKGWGCMLRCGQMVMAQALVCRHLGRDWIWNSNSHDSVHLKIIKLFADQKAAPYSIHQIAQMGVSEGKAIGQWFGPNTVAQVLKKLTLYDQWSSIVVHVAMDNTVIINEIKAKCKGYSNDMTNLDEPETYYLRQNHIWHPLVLVIPLRVGLSDLNPVYIRGLKTCFTLHQSLGMIGGKPHHALYFIGFVGNELIFLDPHVTQQFACYCPEPECKGIGDVDTFHCKRSSRMDITQLDPSVAVCFYCDTEMEFDDLCNRIQKLIIDQEKQPLFELYKDRPPSLLPVQTVSRWNSDEAAACGEDNLADFTVLDRKFDTSDDEFELL